MYTCEEIYAWFTGPEGEPNIGFGRMWHAIQLAEVLPELPVDFNGGTGVKPFKEKPFELFNITGTAPQVQVPAGSRP